MGRELFPCRTCKRMTSYGFSINDDGVTDPVCSYCSAILNIEPLIPYEIGLNEYLAQQVHNE